MAKKLPPKYSYQESLQFSEEVRKKVGNGAIPIEDLAKSLGFSSRNSGEFPFKMASARQFGLLSAPAKSQIQVSQFFKDVKTGDAKEEAIKSSLLGANYYRDLIERFEVPVKVDVSSISTYIETTYDIRKTAANKIARAFDESMEVYPLTASSTSEVVEKEKDEDIVEVERSNSFSLPSHPSEIGVAQKSLDMLGFQIRLSVGKDATVENYKLIEPVIKAQIIELIERNQKTTDDILD